MAGSATWPRRPAFVDALRIVRLPYHLSAVTQAVARVALANADELLAAVDPLRAEPGRPGGLAAPAAGCEVADSDANFVLFGRFADRQAVWQALLDQGCADPGDRSGGLAARVGRHRRGDGGVRGRARPRSWATEEGRLQ